MLEYYVHSENSAYLPKEILVARIEFPDEFEIMGIGSLPDDWNKYPYSASTTKIFTVLAKDRNFFGLKVPSTIVPFEYNILLNPLFKYFGSVEIVDFFDLIIDEKLKSGKQ